MKTAEEILDDHNFVSPDGAVKSHKNFVLACMQEYADQFKPKWVSVKDNLPEVGEKVLVYFAAIDNQLMAITKCDDNGNPMFWALYIDSFTPYHIEEITHWMPLPEKP